MKLVKHIANLGYGSRKQVQQMFREGRITDAQGEVLYADDKVEHDNIRIDGEVLDPPPGLILMLHKPAGYTCSTKDHGRLIYELLPDRFRDRDPVLSSVGRLDRDTSGMLLMTDDGQWSHRITSPRHHCEKTYLVTLENPVSDDTAEQFTKGVQLHNEKDLTQPAVLEVITPTEVRLTITEGRYHQVKRMFAAVGNRVIGLHRERIGAIALDSDMEPGEYRPLTEEEIASVGAPER